MIVNKENMRKWVEDLRTTDAGQATGVLREPQAAVGAPSKYCCLGRACEVAIASGDVDLSWDSRHGSYVSHPGGGSLSWDSSALPLVVRNWLGLDREDPLVAGGGCGGVERDVSAAQANDELHWPFARIADAIEEYYELKDPS